LFVWIISARPVFFPYFLLHREGVGPSMWWNEEVIKGACLRTCLSQDHRVQNLMFDLVFDYHLYSIGHSWISPMFRHPCQARGMGRNV
jgi:hypothetical protein